MEALDLENVLEDEDNFICGNIYGPKRFFSDKRSFELAIGLYVQAEEHPRVLEEAAKSEVEFFEEPPQAKGYEPWKIMNPPKRSFSEMYQENKDKLIWTAILIGGLATGLVYLKNSL